MNLGWTIPEDADEKYPLPEGMVWHANEYMLGARGKKTSHILEGHQWRCCWYNTDENVNLGVGIYDHQPLGPDEPITSQEKIFDGPMTRDEAMSVISSRMLLGIYGK